MEFDKNGDDRPADSAASFARHDRVARVLKRNGGMAIIAPNLLATMVLAAADKPPAPREFLKTVTYVIKADSQEEAEDAWEAGGPEMDSYEIGVWEESAITEREIERGD